MHAEEEGDNDREEQLEDQLIEQINKYDSLLDSFQRLQQAHDASITERNDLRLQFESERAKCEEMHRQVMYMGEERRLMIEKIDKSEVMLRGASQGGEQEKRFMMQ